MNSSKEIINTKEKKRQYLIWNGTNYFLLKGRVYIGSQYYFGLLSNLYIQLYVWLYFVFVLFVRVLYII